MSTTAEYLSNSASEMEIAEHLLRCDADFLPPLSSRVEIKGYAKKIASKATRLEAWSDGALVGLVAVYCDDQETGIAYITSISVLREWTRKGIAAHLMSQCVKHSTASGMHQLSLEVATNNLPAIKLYEKCGFVAGKANGVFVALNLILNDGELHEQEA